MKKVRTRILVLAGLLTALFIYLGCGQPTATPPTGGTGNGISSSDPDSVFLANAGSLAMNNPDKFSWTIFSMICKAASTQTPVSGNTNLTTNNTIWETWADDPITYPASPDPNHPPQWPQGGPAPSAKKLEPITQQSFRNHLFIRKGQLRPQIAPNGGSEEVRRNQASFNFIIQNGLWYTEGLAAAFNRRGRKTYSPFSFPTGAIEVKAIWKSIPKDSMAFYHWNYDASGKLYRLIALHIMTKAIPNWTWATWEWVGNPGRCDYLGCHDTFGVVPENVDSNSTPDKGYPPGSLTPALVQLFKDHGLGDEWKNYRLKGSQTDWIDAMGRTVLLGNSITENDFVQSSSCITCHSVASFDSTGAYQPSVGFTPDNQSQNGPVSPANFWTNPTPPYGKLLYLQNDFVWGVFKAQSAGKK